MFYICCQIKYFIPLGVAVLVKGRRLEAPHSLYMCVCGYVCVSACFKLTPTHNSYISRTSIYSADYLLFVPSLASTPSLSIVVIKVFTVPNVVRRPRTYKATEECLKLKDQKGNKVQKTYSNTTKV